MNTPTASGAPELASHRFTEVFPLMDGDGLAELAADIKERGLDEPIVLFGGAIADGRNRYVACQAAGVAPVFDEFTGSEEELLGWVMARNLQRRHLSPSQRALIAAEVAEPRFRRRGRRAIQEDDKALAVAARTVNVHVRTAQYAATLRKRGIAPLVELVRGGEMSLKVADKIATQTKTRQRRLVAAGPAAMVREYRRLGGKGSGSAEELAAIRAARHAAARPAPKTRAWDLRFTSFGKTLGACGRDEIEAEFNRLAENERLLRALLGRLPATGTVEESIGEAEFAAMLEAARQ